MSSEPRLQSRVCDVTRCIASGSCCRRLLSFESLSSAADARNHSCEDRAAQWQHGVPVQDAEEPLGPEQRGSGQQRAAALRRLDPETQLRFTWHLHLGSQAEHAVLLELDNTPEVERFVESGSSLR